VDFSEPRFTRPICTVADVAQLVEMPIDTVKAWAGQRTSRKQLITRHSQGHRGWPSIPLVGLAEASVLRALKQVLPASEVAAAARWIRDAYETPHALANRRLVTDGAYAYIREHMDSSDSLYRVSTNQRVIVEAVEAHLRPLVFAGDDDYPYAFKVQRLPGVEIDPRFNAGRMAFARNRIPVFAVAGMLEAGEDPHLVALEYGLTAAEVEAIGGELDWVVEAA
jgi:uncharacterized protein (DUF433 family)